MMDDHAEPFVGLTTERQLELWKRHDVIPLIGDLTLVNEGHQFEWRNGVFARFPIEIWKLDDLSFHRDVGVGLNLSRNLSSTIVSLHSGLLLLHILLVEAWTSSDRVVAVVAIVCHCVFEEILFEVVERERVNVFVVEFESLFISL